MYQFIKIHDVARKFALRWTNRFLSSDTNNRPKREFWAKQFINNITRLYKYLPSALFYYRATIFIYVYIAEARRWRSQVCLHQDRSTKKSLSFFPLLASLGGRDSSPRASGNPFISIFNCRCARLFRNLARSRIWYQSARRCGDTCERYVRQYVGRQEIITTEQKSIRIFISWINKTRRIV